MSTANFPKSLAALLQDEGGNDDDKADHGGRTSRGITQREYDKWRADQHLLTRDVWTADTLEITAIYHDDYWEPLCDDLPDGIDYLYFDLAVNAGPHRAAVLLQRTLGVPDDGKVGPQTLLALSKADPKTLIGTYTDAKRTFYHGLNQPRFLKGWLNRCDHVQSVALAMVSGS
jgi:lysozyme family protein